MFEVVTLIGMVGGACGLCVRSMQARSQSSGLWRHLPCELSSSRCTTIEVSEWDQ